MLVDFSTFELPKPPFFIVIDGVNGAGKSTLQARMVEFLAARGVPTLATREPGATELGKKLRALVLEQQEPRMCELAEMFLFAADRSEHVAKVITPSLARGGSVISDRYYYSTIAFQGYGRGIKLPVVESITRTAIGGTLPHLWIHLDLEPAEGLRRNRASIEKSGAAGTDAFELEELQFHTRLRDGFLKLARTVAEPVIEIDASQPAEAVWAMVRTMLERSIHGS
ncbi:MAG: dTMP kinase [Proteobacteria bacterium]|nr:dTMP kinase [Pseudomonadota bacterium]